MAVGQSISANKGEQMMERYKDKNYSARERAEDLVSRMTLEERASQLRYDAFPVERLDVPAYNWWNESLHGIARAGTATMFPQAIGLAAIFDEDVIKAVADVCATEARAKYNASVKQGDRGIYKGLTMWSPNINIFRDPRWGRGQETYGECPYLTARLGVAFIKGLQGEGEILKTASCAKHFAGHSGPEGIRHKFDAVINEKDLNETYLPAFEAAVREAGVESVMGAYNRLNGEPACASDYLMGKLKSWGFDGHFVSDCWAIRDFHTEHKITETAAESAAMALKAGCDCNCGNTYQHIMEAIKQGLIDEETITQSTIRLMKTRIKLGLFDENSEFNTIGYELVSSEAHKQFSLQCAEKSIVLLKNNGILPLNQSRIKSIGVIGPNAASIDALRGNYYGTADEYKTVLEGIRDSFDGRVFYSEGSHLFSGVLQPLAEPGDGYAEAMTVAEHSDIVVLCVGLDATIEGEEGDTGNAFASGDKRDLHLPKTQQKLVEKVLGVGKPTIIINMSGSAINVKGERADAILQAFYPGQMGGCALAKILFGKVSPSGKLPVTFYETAEALPEFEDYSMRNRTYRYAQGNILYPFGYGLTYSKVICREIEYNSENQNVKVKVENIGQRDTDEVIQLYIKDETSKWAVANYNLCGFKRVHLKSGSHIELDFKLDKRAFEVVDQDGRRFVDGKVFTLFAGISQPDELSHKLTGSESVSCRVHL